MEHPIGSMMQATMENLKEMVDVNTVIGEAVVTQEGTTVIPVSKVSFGFVAGGGQYGQDDKARLKASVQTEQELPFAGGTGAGVSVQPVGFLIVDNGNVRMLAAQSSTVGDKVVELLPGLWGDVKEFLAGKSGNKPDTLFTTGMAPALDEIRSKEEKPS